MKPDSNGKLSCTVTYAWASGKSGRNKGRIIAHASVCHGNMPEDLKLEANKQLKTKAPTEKVVEAKQALKDATQAEKTGCVAVQYLLLSTSYSESAASFSASP
jgi:hypothetical protein